MKPSDHIKILTYVLRITFPLVFLFLNYLTIVQDERRDNSADDIDEDLEANEDTKEQFSFPLDSLIFLFVEMRIYCLFLVGFSISMIFIFNKFLLNLLKNYERKSLPF